jgi:predicted N-acyltransferase
MAPTVSVLSSLAGIDATDWDACACPETADGGRPFNPFVTHRFLSALERSGSVGPGTGWQALHLVAREAGRVVGAMPLYAKSHSQGEYIFDHSWADAFERAGGAYYPKLQSAVPFTPVAGPRLICRPGHDAARETLLAGALSLARQNRISSLHVTFCTRAEWVWGAGQGLLQRLTLQYQWQNDNYRTFDDFLARLASRKRKAIRKEREAAQAFGGTIRRLTGDEIRPDHWDAFWAFYQDTGSRKWGHPYLTRAFFEEAHDTMRQDLLLVLAERGGRPVAGALNLIGRDTLFGRYWGAIEDHPCLHFEVCYYQAIEHAIETGLARVEAGAQGEHKIARGYLPARTYSLHWLSDPGLSRAVERFLLAERQAVEAEVAALADLGPFRKAGDAP